MKMIVGVYPGMETFGKGKFGYQTGSDIRFFRFSESVRNKLKKEPIWMARICDKKRRPGDGDGVLMKYACFISHIL